MMIGPTPETLFGNRRTLEKWTAGVSRAALPRTVPWAAWPFPFLLAQQSQPATTTRKNSSIQQLFAKLSVECPTLLFFRLRVSMAAPPSNEQSPLLTTGLLLVLACLPKGASSLCSTSPALSSLSPYQHIYNIQHTFNARRSFFPHQLLRFPCLALPCLALPCLALPCLGNPGVPSREFPAWHSPVECRSRSQSCHGSP